MDGRVTVVPVQVGSRVRADQLLAEVHSHEVHDAWAGYRRAEADVRRLESEWRFATDARTRAGRLLEAKAVSQQDVQRAEANLVAAAQALDVAHTEVRRAEEEMEHLGISGSALVVVQNGTLPTQKQVVSTLAQVTAAVTSAQLQSPALVVVGEVVHYASIANVQAVIEEARKTA